MCEHISEGFESAKQSNGFIDIYTFGENIPVSWSLDSLNIVSFKLKMQMKVSYCDNVLLRHWVKYIFYLSILSCFPRLKNVIRYSSD